MTRPPQLLCLSAISLLMALPIAKGQQPEKAAPPEARPRFREVLLNYENVEGATPTQLPVVGTFDQMLCDDSGSVYLRPMLNLDQGAFANPVVRIDRKGTTQAFGTTGIPGMRRDTYIFAYTVDPSGRVFELVRTVDEAADEMFLVSFSRSGEFLTKSRFESEFRPHSFVALPTDDFLISGVRQKQAVPRTHEAVVGIFGPDARLKRSLKDAKDDRFTPVSSPSGNSAKVRNPAIELGSAKVGPDGNLYVLKSSDPAVVEVFNLAGRQLRALKLAPPFPKAQSHDLFVTPDRVVVMYQRTKDSAEVKEPVVFAEYSLQTAEPLVAHLPRGKGVVACFDASDATVLVSGKDGRFGLLRVPAQP